MPLLIWHTVNHIPFKVIGKGQMTGELMLKLCYFQFIIFVCFCQILLCNKYFGPRY